MGYEYIAGALILLVGLIFGTLLAKSRTTYFIIQKLNQMSEQFEQIKAKMELQNTAIDGLAQDLAFIKGKLANAEGGLTAAEVAELNTLIDARTEKLQALDAETDSTQA